ncbi:MAG TPA: VOC family protein [Candidatus Micrarchaeia archaeon]|nr:VOC family protein [Candidatus Micrarchaeia archaeon]
MPLRLYSVVVAAHDPAALARFWTAALDFRIVHEAADGVVIARDDHTYPGLIFEPMPEAKTTKNRLHLDLAPDDQTAEVLRLTALGAHRVQIGQGADVSWVVLADPEGNEFCVLRSRPGGV